MRFKDLVSDAANFSAMDADYIKSLGGDHTGCSKDSLALVERKPGRYKVTIKSGHAEDTQVIDLKSGILVVGDACYSFQDRTKDANGKDAWSRFLQTSNYLADDDQCASVWDEDHPSSPTVTLVSMESIEKAEAKEEAEEVEKKFKLSQIRVKNVSIEVDRLKNELATAQCSLKNEKAASDELKAEYIKVLQESK